MRRLVRVDRGRLAQRQRNVVEAFEQAFAREVVELERKATGSPRLEIDGQLFTGACALHEREILRMEDDAARVRVLVVDADWKS